MAKQPTKNITANIIVCHHQQIPQPEMPSQIPLDVHSKAQLIKNKNNKHH
jgi:hypothetical protein